MATLAQKIKAEKRMRDLLEESGLPKPDYVEYGFTCIRLFFNDTKHIVVIDIDDPEGVESDLDTDAASTVGGRLPLLAARLEHRGNRWNVVKLAASDVDH